MTLHGIPSLGHPRADDRRLEAADDVTRRAHRGRRVRGDRRRDFVRALEQAVVRHHFGHETELQCPMRVPALAPPREREEGERVQRDPQRERHGLDAAHLTDAHVRVDEPGVLVGDDDVGVGHEVQAASGAHAVHGRDDGSVDATTGQERELVVDAFACRTSFVVEVAHVDARAEGLALARHHHAAHVVVLADIGPELGELAPHRPVERVALLRAVERDAEHVLRPLDADSREGHRVNVGRMDGDTKAR